MGHPSPTIRCMAAPVTVVVVDDKPLVRNAYHAFFSRQTDFELVGLASDGREGVEVYEAMRPDVVLMDLQMPVMSGIDATREICSRWPDACVVALTTFATPEYVVPALEAGAAGYLLKDTGGPALLNALRQALAGDMPLSSAVRRAVVDKITASSRTEPAVKVTQREHEVLDWLAHGLSNAEIAAQMFVSEGSVKQYLSHIGDKLGVKSRTQILMTAIKSRLIDPDRLPPLAP